MTNEQIETGIFSEYAKAAMTKLSSENEEISADSVTKVANNLIDTEEIVAEDLSKIAHLEQVGKSLAHLTWQGHLPVLAKYATGNSHQRRKAGRAADRAASKTEEVVDVAKKVKGMSHGTLAAIVAGAVGAGAIAASALTGD